MLRTFKSGDRAELDNPEPVAGGTRSASGQPLAEALPDKGVEGGGEGGAEKPEAEPSGEGEGRGGG